MGVGRKAVCAEGKGWQVKRNGKGGRVAGRCG